MIVIAVGAGLAHVGEALYCLHLTKNKHKMKKNIILLWTLNVFFVGIFGTKLLRHLPLLKKLDIVDKSRESGNQR